MEDLTKNSPKLSKKEKPIKVFNPNLNPVVANESGQTLSGYGYGIVHPEDSVAKRAIKKGLLQVTSS
jgi:hypothetical protein